MKIDIFDFYDVETDYFGILVEFRIEGYGDTIYSMIFDYHEDQGRFIADEGNTVMYSDYENRVFSYALFSDGKYSELVQSVRLTLANQLNGELRKYRLRLLLGGV